MKSDKSLCFLETKRIAFLVNHLHKGGMQKAISNISNALPENFVQYIVFFGTDEPDFKYKGSKIFLDIPGSYSVGFFRKMYNFYCRKKKIQQFVLENEVDTVVSFGEAANVLNIISTIPRKIISVRTYIENSLSGFYGLIYNSLVKILYSRADVIVAVSNGIKKNLILKYKVREEQVRVVHNLYDLKQLKKLSRVKINADLEPIFSKPTIISVGSLTPLKGIDHLIRSFKCAQKSIPDLQLVIVGSGSQELSLRDLSEDINVKESVHFVGYHSNPYSLMEKSDLFVLTSHLEGMPNVLVEAMICGLPVIATDCPSGPKEILGESEFGVLVDNITAQNEEIIESIIGEWIVTLLTTARGEHFKAKAHHRCQDFSKEKILPNWLELLD